MSPRIAVVTSTLSPQAYATNSGIKLSSYSVQERVRQTNNTITSLKETGVESIFLCDNSVDPLVTKLFSQEGVIPVHRPSAYQFTNKGVNECLLLLSSLDELPDSREIIKISGRYTVNKVYELPKSGWNIAARPSPDYRPNAISTRFYISNSKDSLRAFISLCLREMFAYSSRARGPKSLLGLLKNQFRLDSGISYESPYLMLEQAACHVLTNQHSGIQPHWLGYMGVSGTIANPYYPGLDISE